MDSRFLERACDAHERHAPAASAARDNRDALVPQALHGAGSERQKHIAVNRLRTIDCGQRQRRPARVSQKADVGTHRGQVTQLVYALQRPLQVVGVDDVEHARINRNSVRNDDSYGDPNLLSKHPYRPRAMVSSRPLTIAADSR